MNEPSHRLTLVAAPAEPVHQDDSTPDQGAGSQPLETLPRERFQVREVDAWPNALARSLPGDRTPFAILMTAEQVLEVAADADFRAEILDDLANAHLKGRAQASGRISMGTGDRRVADLREVAVALRRIAADLVDSERADRHEA